METYKLVNGYLQPKFEPEKGGKMAVIALVVTAAMCIIAQTCLL